MTDTKTRIRFFAVACTGNNTDSEFSGDQVDTVEISESCFKDLMQQAGGTAPVQYERHTVYNNGVDQTCLTLDLDQWPDIDELETIKENA